MKQCCEQRVEKSHIDALDALGFNLLRTSPEFLKYQKYMYLLLSPYVCFVSLLYLDLYVSGDDAFIS